MDRSNHYEAAFDAYLRAQRLTVLGIDESRRSWLEERQVKSVDFLVRGRDGTHWLIDVKGRRFPGGSSHRPRRVWENWIHADDLEGLHCWEAYFGEGYRGLLVFAYWIQSGYCLPEATPDVWPHRERVYLFRGILAADYRQAMRVRSERWQTIHLPQLAFRELVTPISQWLGTPSANHAILDRPSGASIPHHDPASTTAPA